MRVFKAANCMGAKFRTIRTGWSLLSIRDEQKAAATLPHHKSARALRHSFSQPCFISRTMSWVRLKDYHVACCVLAWCCYIMTCFKVVWQIRTWWSATDGAHESSPKLGSDVNNGFTVYWGTNFSTMSESETRLSRIDRRGAGSNNANHMAPPRKIPYHDHLLCDLVGTTSTSSSAQQ